MKLSRRDIFLGSAALCFGAKGAFAQTAPQSGPAGSENFDPGHPPTQTVVLPAETLYSVAERMRVPVLGLIEENRLSPPYSLFAGQILRLPPLKVHIVQRGEGISQVAARYNIDTRSLRVFNRLPRDPVLRVGQYIILPPMVRDRYSGLEPQDLVDLIAAEVASGRPAPRPLPTPAAPVAAPVAARPATNNSAQPTDAATNPTPAPTPAPTDAPPRNRGPIPAMADVPPKPANARFNWPVRGQVVERFGERPDQRRNDGIEIAAGRGTPFGAAASGEVVYAGNELIGYGWLALVRHTDGYMTAYAYADQLVVAQGDRVRAGQTIGIVGQTGHAVSARLHFQIRRGTLPIDPVGQLPPLTRA